MIRPGTERIKRVGGLHQFMNCKLPILTDSGGFQIMSLSKLVKIDEKLGAIFKSHIDGKKFILSPEQSIKIQKDLNSDIIMVLDECPKLTKDKIRLRKSLKLSTNWAKRSKDEFGDNIFKGLFGIIQGGIYKDLRLESLEELININFDGYALGGLAVGESQKQMFKVLDDVLPNMPKNKPRYLMGVGTPSDILGAVKRGVDMFDCVIPTRSGRTGLAFTWGGKINLRNSIYKKDDSPINKNENIRNLNRYSKSYINHLINTNEILASMILTMSNISFYQQLMKKIREAIKNNTFDDFYNKYINII
jgi:queuine tRNA-ribosyltransferase